MLSSLNIIYKNYSKLDHDYFSITYFYKPISQNYNFITRDLFFIEIKKLGINISVKLI